MEGWYLVPIRSLRENEHFAFAVMSLCCTLVDALSQYDSGELEGTGRTFKRYLENHFPDFKGKLSKEIKYKYNNEEKTAKTFPDVLYSGFRCGIVHEAHPKLYTVITGSGIIVKEEPAGLTTCADGSHCPTVILDPGLFHDHLEKVFCQYLSDLGAESPQSQTLRNNFKRKFLHSYGIDIGNEA